MTLSGAIATPTTIATSGNVTVGGDLIVTGTEVKSGTDQQHRIKLDPAADTMAFYPGDEATDAYVKLYSAANSSWYPCILPSTTNYGSLGLSTAKWYQGYIGIFYTDEIRGITATSAKIKFDGAGNEIEIYDDAGELRWYFKVANFDIKAHVRPTTDKTYDLGTTSTLRWDDVYADDFRNESHWKSYLNPLELVGLITSKIVNNPEVEFEIPDYETVPDWVRTIDKILDPENLDEPIKEKWISDSISVNRMQVVLIQAIQEMSIMLKELWEEVFKEKDNNGE